MMEIEIEGSREECLTKHLVLRPPFPLTASASSSAERCAHILRSYSGSNSGRHLQASMETTHYVTLTSREKIPISYRYITGT